MEPTRAELQAWLRSVLAKEPGDTPTALARRSGVSSTTLTRFLNDPDNSTVPSLRTIAKIAHAANVDPPLQGAGTRVGFAEPEAQSLIGSAPEPKEQRPAVAALLKGRNAAAPWELRTRALVGVGCLPGDIMIVDLNAAPAAGNIVCAQVYTWSKGTAETVFRVYEPPYLVAASTEPQYRKPLLVDGSQVVIKGVVTDVLRNCLPSR